MTTHLETTEIVLDEREEQARRAVSNFRKLQPTLSSFARILTRDNRVTVQMRMTGISSASSDEKTVYMIPPMALGLKFDHERKLCDKRLNGEQQCKACAVHESIMVSLYHEIGHIAFGTFAQPGDEDKKRLIREAIAATSGAYAARIQAKLESLPDHLTRSYLGLVGTVSEYLPLLLNGLEDARINEASFQARPGTRQMFDANINKVFREGIEQRDPRTGQVKTDFWIDRPQNSQAIIGVFLKASGYPLEGKLIPPVVEAFEDPELTRLCSLIRTTRSVAGTFELSFPILARLRALGFCKAPDEEPLPDDPNEPDPEPGDGDKENEDEKSSSSGGDPEESDPSDDIGDEGSPSGAPGDSDSPGESGDSPEESDSESDSGSKPGSTGAPDPDDGDGGVDDAESEPRETGSDDEGNDGSENEGSEQSDEGQPGEESAGDSSEASDSDDESDSSGSEGSPDSGGQEGSDSVSEGADQGNESEAGTPSGSGPGSGSSVPPSGVGAPEGNGGMGQDPSDVDVDSDDQLDDSPAGESADSSDVQDERDEPGEGLDDSSSGDPAGSPGAKDDGLADVHDDAAPRDEREGATGEDAVGDESDDRGSPTPDDSEGELFESGADEGLGGVQVEEDKAWDDHPMGTADEAEHDLESIEICGERPDSIMEGKPGDEQLIERAIIQGIYFERPSRHIFGVREHHYDKPLISPDGTPLTRAWEKGRRYTERAARRMGSRGEYEPTESMLGPSLLRMRVAFSDNKRANMERHRKSGRVDQRVLGKRAWQDDERLFKVKRLPGKRDYFVCIWLDVSGSTAGTNIDLIKRAAFAQAELCQRMGITFAIYGGSGYFHDPDAGRGAGLDLDVYIIKEPDEPWTPKVQQRLNEIGADAFNLDGHNMEYARHICQKRSETDKIVLYFSDGKMPAENHDEELTIMLREFREYKRRRITLLGVGINTDSPARHGLDTVQINSVEDLSKVVDQLGKYLIVKKGM